MTKKISQFFDTYVLHIAWAQSLIALLGSLYYSEIRHIAPCVLCWYQRICFYPLVAILAIGIVTKDKQVAKYALPLSVTGLIIASYHYLLQLGIIPENLAPCQAGIPCATQKIMYAGFISIPLMSWIGFAIVTGCLLYFNHIKKETNDTGN